jgi:hypothetical protein
MLLLLKKKGCNSELGKNGPLYCLHYFLPTLKHTIKQKKNQIKAHKSPYEYFISTKNNERQLAYQRIGGSRSSRTGAFCKSAKAKMAMAKVEG